jgi:hypothetical protein
VWEIKFHTHVLCILIFNFVQGAWIKEELLNSWNITA